MGNTYQKSSGSAGSKGVDFQINLLSVFLLNALGRKMKDWKLSTENKLARKFDDIVLELSDGSAILLQAKHKDNKKVTLGQLFSANSKNEDFSLPKYFLSYLDVRTTFPVKHIIICTNTQADKRISKFLNRNSICKENMLYYQDGVSFFTLNHAVLPDLLTNARIYHKNNLKGKGFDETLINEKSAKEFLEHLQLYLNYPSGSDLEIVTEKLLSCLKSTSNLLSSISHRDVHQKVKEWFEQPKGEYLTEDRARAMFCEIKSEKYCQRLEDHKVFFESNDIGIADSEKRIFHVVAEGGYLLHLMKVYRSLQNCGTKILCAIPDDGMDVQEQMIMTFELSTYTCVIIVSPKFTEEAILKEICLKLKDILHYREYKRVVFVAEPNNRLAQRMKSTNNDYDIVNITPTLADLSKDTQKKLLEKKSVVFQGEDVSLAEAFTVPITEDHKKSITSDTLAKLISGEKIIVGARVMDMEEEVSRFYMDRKFERITEEVWGVPERVPEGEETFSEEDIFDAEEKTILIADSAGTGKTTVLTNLALKIKKNNPRLWVVKIELNECSKILRDSLRHSRSINVRELLNYRFTGKSTNELERILFSLKGSVVLMFDGVDEISPDYTEQILHVLDQSQRAENVAKVFVTTRPHMTPGLERQLNVSSFMLKSLTEKNTTDFLARYWTYHLKQQSEGHPRCEEYAVKLLSEIAFLMFNYDDEKRSRFITFPLYARMLAEVFLENQGPEEWQGCKEYLEADEGEPKLPERMNIARLYEMFVEKKRDIFMDKGNPSGNATANQALVDQFEECLTYHSSLALKTVLDKMTCELFWRYFRDAKDNETKMLKMGIVQKANDRMCFVHRTFAEYFVAGTLHRELRLQNRDARFQRFLINEVFSNPQFNVLRHFLDNLLRDVVPSLPPEIFENYKSYFGFNDPSLLHRLANEGCTEIIRLLLKCLNHDAVKRSGNVLQDLLQLEGVDLRNDRDLTPLHLAVRGGHLDTARLLVDMGANVNSDSEFVGTTLHLAVSEGRRNVVGFLLESGAEPDIMDQRGRTPLHAVVQSSRWDLVELLVRHGADVGIADAQGVTSLHLAALTNCYDIFGYLTEHGADINGADSRGATPLHFATQGRSTCETLEFLLERGVDVNTADKAGNTALHYAVNHWSREIAEFLLNHGADINIAEEEGNTALHFAVRNESFDVVELFLEHCADANAVDIRGQTALHMAAEKTNHDALSMVELLVKHGADIDIGDRVGSTPLHFAAKCGNADVVEFLIERGANINVGTRTGDSALHLALFYGKWDIVEMLVKHKVVVAGAAEGEGGSEIVDFLVKHGVNVNFSKRGDRKTLHLALSDGRWDIVESLADYGVDIKIPDERGRTALHFAAENGSCKTVEYLVERGVDINSADEEGRTALHLALLSGRWDILECLVKHGADVNARDRRGRTALHFAAESDGCDIVVFLMEHGADINVVDEDGSTALHLATLKDRLNIVEFLLEHGKGSAA